MNWKYLTAALSLLSAAPADAAEPPGLESPPRVAVITNPDWVRRPSSEELERYYPGRALDIRLEGRAVIRCDVSAVGLVESCEVIYENPVDMGFGAAAVRLSASFRMRPQTRDGSPVSGAKVTIPLIFRIWPSPLGDGAQVRGARIFWAQRPDQAQLDNMRPAGVPGPAAVNLRCDVIATGANIGALANCDVQPHYDPTGELSRAAISLAPAFRVAPNAAAKIRAGARIEIPLHWPLGASR